MNLQEICCFKDCGKAAVVIVTVEVIGVGDGYTRCCDEHLVATAVDMAEFGGHIIAEGRPYLERKLKEWEEEVEWPS
jgi:hypothetical protein